MIRLEKLKTKVGVVYLDSPPLNLLTLDMTHRIHELAKEVDEDDDVRAVIITGAGSKAFCAGADIKEFMDVHDNVAEKKLKKENEALLKIERMSKPMIAAINGIALGGGCEIALSCDIRIISDHAKIGLPEVRLGVFPGSGGLYRLPEIVGLSRALEMMYTGEPLTAHDAYRIGLVSHVTPAGQALDHAMRLAEKVAQQSKHALASIKAGVRKSLMMTREQAIQYNLELSDLVFRSGDCEEGVKAFFEKRPPVFE